MLVNHPDRDFAEFFMINQQFRKEFDALTKGAKVKHTDKRKTARSMFIASDPGTIALSVGFKNADIFIQSIDISNTKLMGLLKASKE